MVDFLKSWVLNIITLVIFIVLLEILIPSGKIKKFINLTSGFILIIAIINPFLGLFSKGISLKDLQFADSNIIDKREMQESSKLLKENQMKQISEVYRKKIIRQIEESAKEVKGVSDVKADVIINEDYNSGSFGEIKRVFLSLKPDQKESNIKAVTKIEKIEITKDTKSAKDAKKSGKVQKEVDTGIKKQVEDKINKLLDIQRENIVISGGD